MTKNDLCECEHCNSLYEPYQSVLKYGTYTPEDPFTGEAICRKCSKKIAVQNLNYTRLTGTHVNYEDF
jgi:hypothetical protein